MCFTTTRRVFTEGGLETCDELSGLRGPTSRNNTSSVQLAWSTLRSLFDTADPAYDDEGDNDQDGSAREPLLVADDEVDDSMASPRRDASRSSRPLVPRRLRMLLLTFAAAAALLFISTRSLRESPSCRSPRLISHRGFDADVASVPSVQTVASLLDRDVSSFDVDLFWLSSAAPGSSPLFVGHPPSVRSAWKLSQELPDTPLEAVRTGEYGRLLFPLEELISVLRSRRRTSPARPIQSRRAAPRHAAPRRATPRHTPFTDALPFVRTPKGEKGAPLMLCVCEPLSPLCTVTCAAHIHPQLHREADDSRAQVHRPARMAGAASPHVLHHRLLRHEQP